MGRNVEQHRANARARMAVLRKERQAKGQCERCTVKLGEGDTKLLCRACADKANQRNVKHLAKRGPKPQLFILINGKCFNCKQEFPYQDEYEPCLYCHFRLLASHHLGSKSRWKEIKELWEKQGGICPYTGFQLDFGVDASIDHVLPLKRFPELKNDISNMEFVHYHVNLMKGQMTREEFLDFLKVIYLNLHQEEKSPWAESLDIKFED